MKARSVSSSASSNRRRRQASFLARPAPRRLQPSGDFSANGRVSRVSSKVGRHEQAAGYHYTAGLSNNSVSVWCEESHIYTVHVHLHVKEC